jgi:hypothetical protein
MTYIPPVNGGRINATISGNTAGAGSLVSTGTVTLAGGNNITLSQNGNAITISGGAGGAAGSNTFGMSNLGNTVGTSGVISGSALQFAFAGGNNVTLSQSLNASSGTITISAANQTVQTQNMHNVTLAGNTAGALAHISSGTLTLAGGNNVTLSQNGNAVTISAAAGGGGGGVAIANSQTTFTSGTANFIEGGGAITINSTTGQSLKFSVPQTSSLSATGGLSISTNGSTISLGAPTDATQSYYAPYDGGPLVAGQQGQGTLHIQPAQAPNFQFDRLAMGINYSNATNSSGSQTASFWVGIYTQNNSTLSLGSSTSISFALTASGTAGSYSQYGGNRLVTIGSTNTLTKGRYYIGIISSSASAAANASLSQLVVSQINTHFSGIFGAASNASAQQTLGLGVYSAATGGLPSSIAISNIRGTASMALRPPSVYFLSQTG